MGGGTKYATTTATQTLPSYLQGAYQNIIGNAQGVAGQPYTPYTGGFTADQQAAFGNIRGLWGASDPSFSGASTALGTSMVPTHQNVGAYMSPYISGVINPMMDVMQEQNQRQQQGVIGNAITKGAWGGNRVGVAQAELARQQKLADAQTLGGLYQQGYGQALDAAKADKLAALQAAGQYAGLGQTQMQTALGQAGAQLGAGTQQQQFDYQQYLNQLAFPYQQQSWLAQIAGGLAPSAGGTTTQQTPQGNIFSQLLGAGLGIASLFNRGGRVHAAGGGVMGGMPYANDNGGLFPSYMSGAGGTPYANDNGQFGGYIPQVAIGGGGSGFPKIQQFEEPEDPLANYGTVLKEGASNIKNWLMPAQNSWANPFGFAGGGVVERRGYADGGFPHLWEGLLPKRRDPRDEIVGAMASPTIEEVSRPATIAPADLFGATEGKYGLPSGFLDRTAGIESAYNAGARNPSGASGLFQFMPETAKEYGLADPFDPAASTDAAGRLAAANKALLRNALGREPTAAELYLAHQQGGAGAARLLSNPDVPAWSIVGKQAVLQNGGNLDMSAGQFAGKWLNEFAGGEGRGYGVVSQYEPGNVPGVVPFGAGEQFSTSPAGNYSQNIGDAWKSLTSGKGLNLSPDMRQSLLAAGMGMMASRSPFALAGIGEGGLKGIETWNARQALERENAQQRAANAQTGAGIALTAETAALTAAQAAREAQATQSERWERRYTPAGVIIIDKTRGDDPGRFFPWGSVLPDGSRANPAEAGAEMAGGEPPALFSVEAPKVAVDPLLMAPETVPLAIGQTQQALEVARPEALASSQTGQLLQDMKHSLAQLPDEGWAQAGTDFPQRIEIMKAANTYATMLGFQAPFSESEIAAGENLSKLTTRLGFDLSRILGSGEAASVIESGIAAVPGGRNSKQGAAIIIASLEAANRRRIDYYNFLQKWAATNSGSIAGADAYFQKYHSPELYALSAFVPVEAMERLRQDVKGGDEAAAISEFEELFGKGTARYVLGR